MTSSGLSPEQKIERIERACFHGGNTHSWAHYREGLASGTYQIFDNAHGVCITEIVQAPLKRYLQCWIVAGELPGVMKLQPAVAEHARSNGCDHMSTIGRLGWRDVLPTYGWKKSGLVFTREVGNA